MSRDLSSRLSTPTEHPTFLLFFIFFVFGLGLAGTWVELIKLSTQNDLTHSYDGLITSLVTFAAALLGTSCAQISIDENESKALKTLTQGLIVLCFFAVLITAVGFAKGGIAVSLWGFASILALAVWWIANANSPGLQDPDAPTGGSVEKPLPGNLSEYTTE